MECDLCSPTLQTPILRESGCWRTALNRNQNLLGKTIIVLRRHAEAVTLLSHEEWAQLHDELRWTTERLSKAFSPDHFNYAFLQNQDRHVHLHVIPRYARPRRFAGRDFCDPDYPSHYRVPGRQNILEADALAAIERAMTEERPAVAAREQRARVPEARETLSVDIEGVGRELPLCEVGPGLQIAVLDRALLSERRAVLADDVVSTGSTMEAMRALVAELGTTVVAEAAVFTEGDEGRWEHVLSLGHLPVFADTPTLPAA